MTMSAALAVDERDGMRSDRPPVGTRGSAVRRFEGRAMGSPLRLTTVGAPPARADAAWSAVVAEFEATEEAMSRFRGWSGLMALNDAAGSGARTRVERRLRAALVAADRAGRITGGRFDARILGDLERLRAGAATRTGSGPTLDRARWLTIDGRSDDVALDVPVDLDGIGKGLALRWAWDRARRTLRPADGALLEAGGDLVASTPSPDIGPWRIGVEDPAADYGADPLAVVAVDRGAVATSSVAVHRWSVGGRVVHHLIDPATGEPGGAGLLSVTVAAADPAWAEVWTKSLFLAGRAGIAADARSRGIAAWWATDDGELEMTPAARLLTIWSRADR
jgi:thiamine biosynthesis lipoprotein